MLNIEQTDDLNVVRKIIDEPTIKQYLIEDDYLPLNLSFLLERRTKFFILFSDKNVAGLCIFNKISDKIYMGHIAILPKYRGKIGKRLAELMLNHHFALNRYSELVSRIKKDNKKSLYFVLHLGFKIFGQNKDYKYVSIKNG